MFLAIHVHEASALVVLVVGLVALVLAGVGLQAMGASRNRALAFVVAAFAVFALKGFFGAWALWTRGVEHEVLEMVLAVADLAVVALLFAPLLARDRR